MVLKFQELLSDPAFYANPYPAYARLREADPVMFSDLRGGSWIVTGYKDVAAGLNSVQLSNARSKGFLMMLPEGARDEFKPLAEALAGWALFQDPPRHTRIRRLMGKAFAQTSIDGYRERIEAVTARLLDGPASRGRMDVMAEFAYELPLLVIIELLGVPASKKKEFAIWSDDVAKLLGGAAPSAELARKTQNSVFEMTAFLEREVMDRRREPRNDILTALVQAEEDGDVLTEEEILAQCVLLLFAGHETTRNLIGNGLLALLEHPEQLERVRSDPPSTRNAVEELLRYDSPVQMLSRVVTQDFEFAGRQLKKGQFAMLFLGSANRDSAQFADPDRLDVTRKARGLLSFGAGPHTCLGAQIGRLEAQIAFTALLERCPDMKLDGPRPLFSANFVLRGLKTLPIIFSTKAP